MWWPVERPPHKEASQRHQQGRKEAILEPPAELGRQQVDVLLSELTVELPHNGTRVALDVRNRLQEGGLAVAAVSEPDSLQVMLSQGLHVASRLALPH